MGGEDALADPRGYRRPEQTVSVYDDLVSRPLVRVGAYALDGAREAQSGIERKQGVGLVGGAGGGRGGRGVKRGLAGG